MSLADEAAYFGAVADGVESRKEEIESLRQQLAEFKHGQDAYQQLFNNEKAENIWLHKQITMLRDALEYHQAQTRPIQDTIDALAATEPKP